MLKIIVITSLNHRKELWPNRGYEYEYEKQKLSIYDWEKKSFLKFLLWVEEIINQLKPYLIIA